MVEVGFGFAAVLVVELGFAAVLASVIMFEAEVEEMFELEVELEDKAEAVAAPVAVETKPRLGEAARAV